VEILEVKNILDKGSVELMSHTCKGDLLVVNAARCSFDKSHEIFDHKTDTKLINYLAEHGHVLPFRHPVCTLRIVAPLFVLRQLGKHQVGFSWSEVSRRYIDSDPEFYYPLPDEWRERSDNIKQGSSNDRLPTEDAIIVDEKVENVYRHMSEVYESLLERGVCPEQARMILPQSMFTTTVTTGTLLGWHHLYKLRTEEHTQKETQEFAKAIGKFLGTLFPVSWEALCKH